MSTSPRCNGARVAATEDFDDANGLSKVDKSPPSRPPPSLLLFFLPTAVVLSICTLLAGLRATSLGIIPSMSATSRTSTAILDAIHATDRPQDDLEAPALLTGLQEEALTQEHEHWGETPSRGSRHSVEIETRYDSNAVSNSNVPSNSTSNGDDESDNTPDDDEVESDKRGEDGPTDGKEKTEESIEPHTFVALAQVMGGTACSCLK